MVVFLPCKNEVLSALMGIMIMIYPGLFSISVGLIYQLDRWPLCPLSSWPLICYLPCCSSITVRGDISPSSSFSSARSSSSHPQQALPTHLGCHFYLCPCIMGIEVLFLQTNATREKKNALLPVHRSRHFQRGMMMPVGYESAELQEK